MKQLTEKEWEVLGRMAWYLLERAEYSEMLDAYCVGDATMLMQEEIDLLMRIAE